MRINRKIYFPLVIVVLVILVSPTSFLLAENDKEVELSAEASLFINEGWLVFDGTVSVFCGHLIFRGVNGDLFARVKMDTDLPPSGDVIPIPFSSFSAHVRGIDALGTRVNQNISGTALIKVENGRVFITALTVEIPVPLPPLQQLR